MRTDPVYPDPNAVISQGLIRTYYNHPNYLDYYTAPVGVAYDFDNFQSNGYSQSRTTTTAVIESDQRLDIDVSVYNKSVAPDYYVLNGGSGTFGVEHGGDYLLQIAEPTAYRLSLDWFMSTDLAMGTAACNRRATAIDMNVWFNPVSMDAGIRDPNHYIKVDPQWYDQPGQLYIDNVEGLVDVFASDQPTTIAIGDGLRDIEVNQSISIDGFVEGHLDPGTYLLRYGYSSGGAAFTGGTAPNDGVEPFGDTRIHNGDQAITLELSPIRVPEPTSLVLLGLSGLMVLRRGYSVETI